METALWGFVLGMTVLQGNRRSQSECNRLPKMGKRDLISGHQQIGCVLGTHFDLELGASKLDFETVALPLFRQEGLEAKLIPEGPHASKTVHYSHPRSEERRVGKECRTRWK